MTLSLWMGNLLAYSLQIAVWIGVGLALPYLLRLRNPRWQLAYLQLLFLGVLLLPFMQPWLRERREVERVSAGRVRMSQEDFLAMQTSNPFSIASTSVGPFSVQESAPKPQQKGRFEPTWLHLLLLLCAAGMLTQLVRILIGLALLRDYRNDAEDFPPFENVSVAVCNRIGGPVTFGFFDPIILLPRSALTLPREQLDAILAHELVHVRRRDWVFSLIEELALAVLWFHPAVWVLVEELRLNREKVVDAEVRKRSGADDYVEALVRMASSNLQPYFAAAPSFLRRRHLSSRIQTLRSEVPMSRSRLVAGYAATAIALSMFLIGAVSMKPLRGAPQTVERPSNLPVSGATVIYSPTPAYPTAARARNIEGTVHLEISIAANGEVPTHTY